VGRLLIVVVAVLVTWCISIGFVFVFLRWRLARSNRVSPAVKSPAPIRWLWLPTRVARMHRRLRTAVAMIHLAPSRRVRESPSLSVDQLRRELEYQAVELDQHLVVAAHHPRSFRRGLLRSLETQIAEVEALAVRLSGMIRPDELPASGWMLPDAAPEVLNRIATQLDLLDAAQEQLADIERASGLVDIDSLLSETNAAVAVVPPPPNMPAPLETGHSHRSQA